MIEFDSDAGPIQCTMQQYIDAKTKDLREFGYPDLTKEHVEQQLQYVLEGRRPLDVIGHFIKGDNPKEIKESE